ncbi:MAG: PAS-domain containing protein [Alphaproteobacteria bacterium]|nr:PAS-domain containing protein [Alphaproteobacteria bacterium]
MTPQLDDDPRATARLGALLECINDAAIIVDEAGRIVVFNRNARQLFGYDEHEVVGRQLDILLPEGARENHARHLRGFASSAEPIRRMGGRPDVMGRRKDGSIFAAEASIARFGSGDALEFLAVVRNLDGLRPGDAELVLGARAAKAQFLGAIDHLSEGLAYFDADRRLQQWNAPLCRLIPDIADRLQVGLPLEAFTDALLAATSRLSLTRFGDDATGTTAADSATGEFVGECAEFRTSQGRVVEACRRIIPDGGIIELYRDVTDLHAKQAALQRAVGEKDAMLREQRRFLAIANHEFRTPLAIIDSSSQLLRARLKDHASSTVTTRLDRIRRAVERIVDTIDWAINASDILDAPREERIESFDLCVLVDEITVALADVHHAARISIAHPPEPLVIEGDRSLVGHAVENIVSNAIKFSGLSPEVVIETAAEGDVARVAVTDNGIGIPESEREAVFERYHRASNSAGTPGSGIGLYLVSRVAQLHGGFVRIETPPRPGTRMVLGLPFRFPTRSGDAGEKGRDDEVHRDH